MKNQQAREQQEQAIIAEIKKTLTEHSHPYLQIMAIQQPQEFYIDDRIRISPRRAKKAIKLARALAALRKDPAEQGQGIAEFIVITAALYFAGTIAQTFALRLIP